LIDARIQETTDSKIVEALKGLANELQEGKMTDDRVRELLKTYDEQQKDERTNKTSGQP
jgi:hypothetical protein